MEKNEITRLAREAGFVGMDGDHGALRRFASLVAKQAYLDGVNSGISAEREACAKVCMNLESRADIPDGGPQAWWEIGCVDCADAIRARGNHANG